MNIEPAAAQSALPATPQSGLPVVNQALEPEWVRHGSPATQKAYQSALSFEATLVEQLSKSFAASSGVEGEGSQEGESESESGSSALSSTLPQALSAGIMNAGGLGLAAQLTRGLPGADPGTTAAATGGSTAIPATQSTAAIAPAPQSTSAATGGVSS
jgi:hypothetical protein